MRSICDILKESKNIAVVGISEKPGRDSREIAFYLKRAGYNVAGVNPLAKSDEINGIKIYKQLGDVPFEIDIVDVFRRSEHIPELIPDILRVKPKVLWLQLGIVNSQAMKECEAAGIEAIEDTCILIEHRNCH